MTKEIGEKITHLFKNTYEVAPVGSLGEYLAAKNSAHEEAKKDDN